jgi:hypothetical protein
MIFDILFYFALLYRGKGGSCLYVGRNTAFVRGRDLYETLSLIGQNSARKARQFMHSKSTQVRSGCRVVEDADGMTPVCRALSVRVPLY